MAGSIAEQMMGIVVVAAAGHTVEGRTASVVAYIAAGNTVEGRTAVAHIVVVVEHTVEPESIVLELSRKLERQMIHLEHIVAAVVVGMASVGMDLSVAGRRQLVGGSMACVVCHKSHVTGSMALVGLASQCTDR